MKFLFSCYFLLLTNTLLSQETISLDSLTDNRYQYSCDVSSDGKFIWISEKIGASVNCSILKSTNNTWKKKYNNASEFIFSDDGKWIFFKKENDTLSILKLGSDECRDIALVSSFKIRQDGRKIWLAYKTISGSVVVQDILASIKHRYDSAADYFFYPTANFFLVQTKTVDADTSVYSVNLLNLGMNRSSRIWTKSVNSHAADIFSKFSFSPKAAETAFLAIFVDKINNNYSSSLWYYDSTLTVAVELINDKDMDLDSDLTIGNVTPRFSNDNDLIFLRLQKKLGWSKPEDAKLQIWSSSDSRLPSMSPDFFSTLNYSFAFNPKTKKMIQISHSDEIVRFPDKDMSTVLIEKCKADPNESNWNSKAESSYYLMSCLDGSRKLIKDHLKCEAESIGISPEAKWLIFYDSSRHDYFSYEIKTAIVRNITKDVGVSWINEDSDIPNLTLTWNPVGSMWTKNDEKVFITDDYDIWLVDPSCRTTPINITNGYGRRNHIKFKIVYDEARFDVSKYKEPIIFSAFNKVTKENGFFEVSFGSRRDPIPLTMGPFVYYWTTSQTSCLKPKKARFAQTYIVQRMSSLERPNLYLTRDFTNYKLLTDFCPDSSYGEMNTELITWKTLDGSYSQGVLYKPSGFDSTRKYPLIFHFYERMSDYLNEYLSPSLCDGPLNMPLFVNRGYLVFTPDIHYTVGEPGTSVVNSVLSAVDYFKSFNWIDSTRIGIQGHSWGGYEVNYLLTQTHVFAAAAEAAGPSDFISDYDLMSHHGKSRTWLYELNQSRLGRSLWQRPDLYIKNSPIFGAGKVQTPLLIMHNEKDDQVPWSQGLEWFMALRRLGKQVWMLNYKAAGHSLYQPEDELDYTSRLFQFFDYYLKGGAEPTWMSKEEASK